MPTGHALQKHSATSFIGEQQQWLVFEKQMARQANVDGSVSYPEGWMA